MCVTFTIIDDAELEEREYFRFRLTSQSANAITLKEGNDVLIVHILDDESEFNSSFASQKNHTTYKF